MHNPALEILNQKNLTVGLCSRGISRIRHLDRFLQLDNATYKYPANMAKTDLFIGWGNKPSGRKAVKLAKQSGSHFLLLEDAFIRSYAPQTVSGEQTLGLILDDKTIYYDASNESRLENLIKQNCQNPSAADNGQKLINQLSTRQICKYNNYDPHLGNLPPALKHGEFVLVVDQTWQDLSVSGAGATDTSFTRMLEAAIDENPGRIIVVKLHPEVLAGKKKGYLKDLAIKYGCTLLTDNINPWQMFDHVSTVYTVSSQLGFDALMAGCKVRCFAIPFYAGWGLTGDELKSPQRSGFSPTVQQIADAALNKYARYLDAYNAVPCSVATTIKQLAHIRDTHDANKSLAAFYQITPWKWQRVKQMFAQMSKQRLFFFSQKTAIKAAVDRGGDLVAWASRIDETLEKACAQKGVKLHRLEDGFIRSVGLGTNFHLPMSLIIDDLGIYYNPGSESRLEHILQNHQFDDSLLARTKRLIKTIVEKQITKYNQQHPLTGFELPKDSKIIFVPGQVDDDASIKLAGDNMTAIDLLSAVRAANPDSFIIFKPHPDVMSGQRTGLSDEQQAKQYADLYITDTPVNHLIDACDEVHTISSLTGFEALLRNKTVHCHGLPFYAGWGLTQDHRTCPRRNRKLSLEALVAATLILYPRYYDPVSKLPCGPELIIQRIEEQRIYPIRPSILIRCRSAFGKLKSYLR